MWAHAGKVTYLCLGSLEADVRDAANYVQDRYQLGDVGKGDKDVNVVTVCQRSPYSGRRS